MSKFDDKRSIWKYPPYFGNVIMSSDTLINDYLILIKVIFFKATADLFLFYVSAGEYKEVMK